MKEKRMPPTIANGKICYIEMPSKDVAGSASFYRKLCNRSERIPRSLRRGFGILRGMCWGCIRSRRGAAARELSSSGWPGQRYAKPPEGNTPNEARTSCGDEFGYDRRGGCLLGQCGQRKDDDPQGE